MIDLERAVPDLERPPSHPGAGGVAVLCGRPPMARTVRL